MSYINALMNGLLKMTYPMSLRFGQFFGAQQLDFPLPLLIETRHRQRSHIWDCSYNFGH